MLIGCFLYTPTAQAAKARSIQNNEDSEYHAQHLQQHIGENICHATGNYIKVRSNENINTVIGHLEQADNFDLLDVKVNAVLIRITNAYKTSPDSWNGMEGWVNSDYIDCNCDAAAYTQEIDSYIGTTSVRCKANNLRVRNAPAGEEIIGHIEQADQFLLLDTQDGWAEICVIKASDDSPDSWNGLTGWVSMDYLQVNTNADYPTFELVYSEECKGYGGILDFFYRAIDEKWDAEKISYAGFEPYEFLDSVDNCGFMFRDIDGNGIDELFIIREADAQVGRFLAGYTLVKGYPVRIFNSWARSRKYLCEDGRIYHSGSDGASCSICYLYKLKGAHLVFQEGIFSGDTMNGHPVEFGWNYTTQEDNGYYNRGIGIWISDEEACQRMKEYESMILTSLDGFISFAEYAKNKNK